MRYRRLLLGAALVVAAGCDETTAITDNVNVGLGNIAQFNPSDQTLATKKAVTFIWAGGPHNVTWQDGFTGSANMTSGTYQRDFTLATSGPYRYRCTLHSTDFVTGMVGRITVP